MYVLAPIKKRANRDVSDTKITEAAVKELKLALPNCRIVLMPRIAFLDHFP